MNVQLTNVDVLGKVIKNNRENETCFQTFVVNSGEITFMILDGFDSYMFYRMIANLFHVSLTFAYWWSNGVAILIVLLVVILYVWKA